MVGLLAKALAIAVITYGPCPDPGMEAFVAGCVVRPNQVYVSRTSPLKGPLAPIALEQVRNHELGHVIDFNLLTNADRGTFEYLTHQTGRPWTDPDPYADQPQEQFAEAVRLCGRSTRWLSRYEIDYGYDPTLRQHRKMCRWLASIGSRP